MVAKGLEPLTRVAKGPTSHYYNVVDYGADPTGVGDSTSAFQTCLNFFRYDSAIKGGRIILPAGTYSIGTPLVYEGNFNHSFVMQGDTQGESTSTDGPTLIYTGKVFTADAGTDVVTATAHGYSTDQAVVVSSNGTLPAPLVGGTTYYVRDVTTNTFKLAASAGGAAIDLTSAGTGTHSVSTAGGILLLLKGANWCRFEDIQFYGNGLTLITVAARYDVPRNMSSFDCSFYNCGFGGSVGTDSTLLQFGDSNTASAEHNVKDCRFIYHGSPGGTYYGITGSGFNAKNYNIENCEFLGLKWGLALGNSGYHRVSGCSFANNTEGDIKASSAQMSMRDCGSEGSTRFIDGRGVSVIGALNIQDCYWAGITVGDNFVISYNAQLTLMNNDFYNDRVLTLKTFTVDTSTDVITSTAHGFDIIHPPIRVNLSSTGTLPSPLTANTNYWLRDATTNSFKLSTVDGGPAVDLTTTGTGTHSVWIPVEPAIMSGVGWGATPHSGSVFSVNNLYVRPAGTPTFPYVPIYDASFQLTSTTLAGSSGSGPTDPDAMRGIQLFSFGDKSRPINGDVDANFPPRITAHLSYLLGISSTAVRGKNLRGSTTFASSDTVTVTFPAAEPDASYFVQISKNAAEDIWWSSPSITGFTLNSSNPSSTATVHWFLVR